MDETNLIKILCPECDRIYEVDEDEAYEAITLICPYCETGIPKGAYIDPTPYMHELRARGQNLGE